MHRYQRVHEQQRRLRCIDHVHQHAGLAHLRRMPVWIHRDGRDRVHRYQRVLEQPRRLRCIDHVHQHAGLAHLRRMPVWIHRDGRDRVYRYQRVFEQQRRLRLLRCASTEPAPRRCAHRRTTSGRPATPPSSPIRTRAWSGSERSQTLRRNAAAIRTASKVRAYSTASTSASAASAIGDCRR